MILFILRIIIYIWDYRIILEWLIISVNSINIELILLIDWVSLLFISFIIIISSIIILYRYVYIIGNKYIKRFIYLILLFVLSIILIIISPNIIRIIFGWDGLGLVSYCLIIFYQNYRSYNSGIVTVLCNRIGDVGLLIAIRLIISRGRWNIILYRFENRLIVLILLIAAITKRAQIPFSRWLPIAIAAPTPVSALVHSSTLVTAGIYLIIRFNKLLIINELNKILFFLSVFTIFISGLIANLEVDLKKIIALSTLRQLGLIIIILSLGLDIIAFYHLLVHAIFKSILFMCAGAIIHSIFNNQDIRLLGNLKEIIPFVIMCFFIANLALCGFPFISGFYSKDFIMELIYRLEVNIYILIFIIISLIFTVSYSIRLYYYIFFGNLKFYRYKNLIEDKFINISIIILVFLRIVIGSILNWLFFFDYYLIFLRFNLKILTLLICIIGFLVIIIFKVKFLYNNLYIRYYLSSIWFKNYFYIRIYVPFNLIGKEIYIIDKTWVEFKGVDFLVYIIKYINRNLIFKVYIHVIRFFYLIILIYLLF